MLEDRHHRCARINLPHARTVVARIGRGLAAEGAELSLRCGEQADSPLR